MRFLAICLPHCMKVLCIFSVSCIAMTHVTGFILPLLFTVLIAFTGCGQTTKNTAGQFSTKMEIAYSRNVGDSFEIYISVPPTFDTNNTYNIAYYCDANLRSGKHLRDLLAAENYHGRLD